MGQMPNRPLQALKDFLELSKSALDVPIPGIKAIAEVPLKIMEIYEVRGNTFKLLLGSLRC